MDTERTDSQADIVAAEDRGESIGLMEPMIVSESSRHRTGLADLALELAAGSAAFKSSLPSGILKALADLVRSMNCYYSNLIEGHNTHPVDIERALKQDYSADTRKRDLQLEAKAHIAVQSWIDTGGLVDSATTEDGIREIHRRFCELLPDTLLSVTDPGTGEQYPVQPGGYRRRDVQVGRHIPISPGAVPRFMGRFEKAYARSGKVDAILAAASAHHRLLWVHPFQDGNGRVARLMTHAMLLQALDTGALWSVARGLARNETDYKAGLASCDLDRRNDLDGRGNLSEEELAAFTHFFLNVCLDQVRFMRQLMEPNKLRTRILQWVEEEIRTGGLPAKSGTILDSILYRGALPRADVPTVLGVTDRQGRRITSALLKVGVLISDDDRSPLRLAFPARLAYRWMPGLFPEQTDPA